MPDWRNSSMPDPVFSRFLIAQGIARADEDVRWTALAGGVSSDIWRADVASGSACVKRALPQLKVQAEWKAPVSRNAYEWAWLQVAAQHIPDHVPRPIAHDADAGLFAMEFLDPQRHPVWKVQLMHGLIEPATAAAVGHVVGLLHARSAADASLGTRFDSGANFHALRLEPYLVAAAARHPQCAERLQALVERTASTRLALVHGDVSPKNILVGPKGPVILDAECAWWGDPAFDVAFCLNHLLLKALVQPARIDDLRQCFDAFVARYRPHVAWEPPVQVERRAAELLPGLLLARCDGKSPVEYLRGDADRETIRAVARPLLLLPPVSLAAVADAWYGSVRNRS